jgi:hypothetical protein
VCNRVLVAAQVSGVLWVIDSPLGHLSVAHRGGYLSRLYHRRVDHFRNVDLALDSLEASGPPDAILLGYIASEGIDRLVSNETLRTTPKLLADTHSDLARWATLESVYPVTDDIGLYDAMEHFASEVVNSPHPQWPPKRRL